MRTCSLYNSGRGRASRFLATTVWAVRLRPLVLRPLVILAASTRRGGRVQRCGVVARVGTPFTPAALRGRLSAWPMRMPLPLLGMMSSLMHLRATRGDVSRVGSWYSRVQGSATRCSRAVWCPPLVVAVLRARPSGPRSQRRSGLVAWGHAPPGVPLDDVAAVAGRLQSLQAGWRQKVPRRWRRRVLPATRRSRRLLSGTRTRTRVARSLVPRLAPLAPLPIAYFSRRLGAFPQSRLASGRWAYA